MILSQLTDIKEKEQRARGKVATKMVRQKTKCKWKKDERRREQNNNKRVHFNPAENAEALTTVLRIIV